MLLKSLGGVLCFAVLACSGNLIQMGVYNDSTKPSHVERKRKASGCMMKSIWRGREGGEKGRCREEERVLGEGDEGEAAES